MKKEAPIMYPKWCYFQKYISKDMLFSFDLRKMTHRFVPTNFNEMNELSNSELFFSIKITITYDQLPIMRFF